MGFSPLGTQSLAYRLPSSEPTGRQIHPYSALGFPPVRRQLRCGISPTRKITLTLGLLPLGGARSLPWVVAPIQKRIQSVIMLYPHFRPFLYRSRRRYDHMCLGIFMRVFLIGLSPRPTSPVWAYSDRLPEDKSDTIVFLTLSNY